MLSKKYYVQMSRLLKYWRDDHPEVSDKAYSMLIRMLSDAYQVDNSRFDAKRFREASGLKDGDC